MGQVELLLDDVLVDRQLVGRVAPGQTLSVPLYAAMTREGTARLTARIGADELAADNARYQQEDYKLGLVTNLDVLNALNSVLQTRLALSQAKVQERATLLSLETAAGMEIK